MVNLLETPTEGTILLHKQSLTDLDKKQLRIARNKIGMIFQSFNLVTNKTVADNIKLALRFAKIARKEWDHIVYQTLKIVDLLDKIDQ